MQHEEIMCADGTVVHKGERIIIKHKNIGNITGRVLDIERDSHGLLTYVHLLPDYCPEHVISCPNDLIESCMPASSDEVSGDKMVHHPPHYQSSDGLEVIDAIKAFTSDLTGIEAVCTGNVMKYICRWKKKNGLQDLNKAKWYLDFLINHIEKENEKS